MTDVLRLLVVGEAMFLIGFAAALLIEAHKFKTPPYHVWWIVVSYSLLVLQAALGLWDRVGDPAGHRLPLAFVAFTFGIVAMLEMWRTYRYPARAARHARLASEAADKHLAEFDAK